MTMVRCKYRVISLKKTFDSTAPRLYVWGMAKKIYAVRIEPELWRAAMIATRKRDTTVTAVIKAALEAYVRKPVAIPGYTPKRLRVSLKTRRSLGTGASHLMRPRDWEPELPN